MSIVTGGRWSGCRVSSCAYDNVYATDCQFIMNRYQSSDLYYERPTRRWSSTISHKHRRKWV